MVFSQTRERTEILFSWEELGPLGASLDNAGQEIFSNALSGRSRLGVWTLLSPCAVLSKRRRTDFAPLWSMQVVVSSPRPYRIYCSYLADEPASRYAPHTGPFGLSRRFPLGNFRDNPAFRAGRILRGAYL